MRDDERTTSMEEEVVVVFVGCWCGDGIISSRQRPSYCLLAVIGMSIVPQEQDLPHICITFYFFFINH